MMTNNVVDDMSAETLIAPCFKEAGDTDSWALIGLLLFPRAAIWPAAYFSFWKAPSDFNCCEPSLVRGCACSST
jgi:hypothetical protein